MHNMSLVKAAESSSWDLMPAGNEAAEGKMDPSLSFSAMVHAIDTAYRLNKQNKTDPQDFLAEILDKIYKMSADEIKQIDSEGNTLLHMAFSKDNEISLENPRHGNLLLLPIVQALLEKGIEVDIQNLQGRTALHQACENRSDYTAAVVELLIARGANVHIKDREDNLPIHIICANKSGSCSVMARIKTLLAHHARINAKNLAGKVAIQIAHENRRTDAVQLLLNSGAKIPPDLLKEIPEAKAKQIPEPSEEDLAEERCYNIPLNWYAASKGIESVQCDQLYQDTALVVQDLNKPKYWHSFERDRVKRQIVVGGFCRSKEQNELLVRWILQSTDKNLNGPYRPINDLFYCVRDKEMPLPLKNILQQIDNNIECLSGKVITFHRLPKEIEGHIFSFLDTKNLLLLRLTSKQRWDTATEVLSRRNLTPLNFYPYQGLYCSKLTTMEKIKKFYGSHLLRVLALVLENADDTAIQEMVSSNRGLRILALCNSRITNEAARYLSTLAFLEVLDLRNSSLADFTFLQHYKALSRFSLTRYSKGTLDLSCLMACKNLKCLSISESEVSSLNLLQKWENLEELDLRNIPNLKDFKFLQYCVNLKRLVIDNSIITAADLNILQYCPNLKVLCLSNCINLSGVNWLQHCPNLEELRLVNLNNHEYISHLDALRHCKKLSEFQMIDQKIRDLTFLENSSLEKLVIKTQPKEWGYTIPFPFKLMCWGNLRTLILENVRTIDFGFLEQCKKIKILVLKNEGDDYRIDNFESLQHCQDLISFELINLGPEYIHMKDLNSLGLCKKLKNLNLSGCLISDISFVNDLENLQTLSLFNTTASIGKIEDLKRFKKYDIRKFVVMPDNN